MPEAEDAAYRAGVLDARLVGLEAHALAVNGTIERTGKALVDLTLSVEKMGVTLDLLNVSNLQNRIQALEKWQGAQNGITYYRRWLLGAGVSLVATLVAILALVLH